MASDSLLSGLSCPVIPVVVIEQIEHALPLAEALFSGGIAALEITLRTDVGLKAISKIKAEFSDRPVGAGTVCTAAQFDAAAHAGADFIVAPRRDISVVFQGYRVFHPIPARGGDGVRSDACVGRGSHHAEVFSRGDVGGRRSAQRPVRTLLIRELYANGWHYP